MDRNEMIQLLMEKAKVNYDEAKEALEKSNWDMLDAIIYLERIGRVENNETTTIIEIKAKEEERKEDKYGGVGEIIRRMFRLVGKGLKKCNTSFFEAKKKDEKTIRISLTVLIILSILLTFPVVVLLVVGLFTGYKYSISSINTNYDTVNNIFEEVSKSADNIKKDFSEGYQK